MMESEIKDCIRSIIASDCIIDFVGVLCYISQCFRDSYDSGLQCMHEVLSYIGKNFDTADIRIFMDIPKKAKEEKSVVDG